MNLSGIFDRIVNEEQSGVVMSSVLPPTSELFSSKTIAIDISDAMDPNRFGNSSGLVWLKSALMNQFFKSQSPNKGYWGFKTYISIQPTKIIFPDANSDIKRMNLVKFARFFNQRYKVDIIRNLPSIIENMRKDGMGVLSPDTTFNDMVPYLGLNEKNKNLVLKEGKILVQMFVQSLESTPNSGPCLVIEWYGGHGKMTDDEYLGVLDFLSFIAGNRTDVGRSKNIDWTASVYMYGAQKMVPFVSSSGGFKFTAQNIAALVCQSALSFWLSDIDREISSKPMPIQSLLSLFDQSSQKLSVLSQVIKDGADSAASKIEDVMRKYSGKIGAQDDGGDKQDDRTSGAVKDIINKLKSKDALKSMSRNDLLLIKKTVEDLLSSSGSSQSVSGMPSFFGGQSTIGREIKYT